MADVCDAPTHTMGLPEISAHRAGVSADTNCTDAHVSATVSTRCGWKACRRPDEGGRFAGIGGELQARCTPASLKAWMRAEERVEGVKGADAVFRLFLDTDDDGSAVHDADHTHMATNYSSNKEEQ